MRLGYLPCSLPCSPAAGWGQQSSCSEAVGSGQQKFVVCLQMCAKDACCTTQCKLKPGSKCSLGLCCERCQVRCVCPCWELMQASR